MKRTILAALASLGLVTGVEAHPPVTVVSPVAPVVQPVYYSARVGESRHALERHLERHIQLHFGRWVDDVDVRLDPRCGVARVEVEIRHPAIAANVERYVASLRDLAGYQVNLRIRLD